MANYKTILDKTIKFEGGYQNFPNDSANYNSKKELIGTNRGISAIALEEYWRQIGKNQIPTVSDVKALTVNDAEKIYKKLFWDKIKGDNIVNQSIAWIIFDSYIASGNLKRVKNGIAKELGKDKFPIDTKIFTDTQIELINKANASKLFDSIKENEIQSRKDIVKNNPSQEKFLKGWLNRLDNIKFIGANDIITNPLLFFFVGKYKYYALGGTVLIVGGVITYFYLQKKKGK